MVGCLRTFANLAPHEGVHDLIIAAHAAETGRTIVSKDVQGPLQRPARRRSDQRFIGASSHQYPDGYPVYEAGYELKTASNPLLAKSTPGMGPS